MYAERIVLSRCEQKRAMVLNRVPAGQVTRAEAAQILCRSDRQVRRLLVAYRTDGPAALVPCDRERRVK